MSRRLKKKYKSKLIFLVLILMIALVLFLIYNYAFSLHLIGDNSVNLTLGTDYFENGYKASILGKDTDNVKIKNNVNSKKLGDYKVIYELNIGFIKKKITRTVHVIDDELPIIKLFNDDYLYLSLNDNYTEPGYEATDNQDGDLTKRVVVTGEVDTSSPGKYEIKYTVTDSSGNTAKEIRTVEVSNENLLTASVADFRLEGQFKDVILEPTDKEYDYINDTVFLGDSNTVFLYQYGKFISAKNTWGKYNLSIQEINNSTFTMFDSNKTVTLKEALDTYRPKYLIVQSGLSSAMHLNKDTFLIEVEKFINFMQTNYSDVTLIFSAVFPIYNGSVNVAHMQVINQYNYYVVKLCRKYKLKFINFADKVKSNEGIADTAYYDCTSEENCGFHLNKTGKEMYINYIKHLNLGGE